MGGFSQASKFNEAGAFTNLAADEQCNCGNDIKQFGQLLATLLGYCHGSSEYTKVNVVVRLYVSFKITKERMSVHFIIKDQGVCIIAIVSVLHFGSIPCLKFVLMQPI